MATTPNKAVSVPQLDQASLVALLRESKLVEEEWDTINRVKMDGFTFAFGEDDIRISNPKPGSPPAFRARLLDTPIEYQAAWIDEALAIALGRENAAKSFCKSYFGEPEQARKFAEDGTACTTCPIHPFVKKADLPAAANGKRCQWKGDLQYQLIDDDGTISDPTVWTHTLSPTGMIEFKGTGKAPEQGSATDESFMYKLAKFGAASDPDNQTAGVARALSALRLGSVLVEVRSVLDKSEDGARTWNVPVFTPYDIVEFEQAAALPAGEPTVNGDDLPF